MRNLETLLCKGFRHFLFKKEEPESTLVDTLLRNEGISTDAFSRGMIPRLKRSLPLKTLCSTGLRVFYM